MDYYLIMNSKFRKPFPAISGPVLITGHTGFKGTWLTLLLEQLGIKSVGFSLPPTENSLYSRLNRAGAITEFYGDIREKKKLERFIELERPKAVIHLAAQPIVLNSYLKPLETFEINVMGTANLLDICDKENSVENIIIVTTDKVYKNFSDGRAYREQDSLSARDPYSASKVATESVVRAWQEIESIHGGPKLLAARTGNVIGGGDFSPSRLLPDVVRAYISNQPCIVRNKTSTRPWQHVLEPLWGYVLALEKMQNSRLPYALNFGPREKSRSVSDVIDVCKNYWPDQLAFHFLESKNETEEISLDLDSNEARNFLGWECLFDQELAIRLTLEWWDAVLDQNQPPLAVCKNEISEYLDLALRQISESKLE
jgi:CDP-glucose 4,6-dehydratase